VLSKSFMLQWVPAVNYSTLDGSRCHHLHCYLFSQLSNEAQKSTLVLNLRELSLLFWC
jgi:hypothetical protein